MDVLTQAFELEGWATDHLTFPRVFYTPDIKFTEGSRVHSILPARALIPYIDRFMWWFPGFLFEIIRRHNVRSLGDTVDFTDYDCIVLESGKPLFLLPEIRKSGSSARLVYRQSDSVRLVLGKGRWYRALEDDVFRDSFRIILKKKLYKEYIPEKFRGKAVTVENGMALPDISSVENPFKPGSRNAVYVGLHALDAHTLKRVLETQPELNLHVIGPCLTRFRQHQLSRYPNFFYRDFLPKEVYMPMLKSADLAIFPFVRSDRMKWFGLTSKFLHFMYFNLPIVSYPTGAPGEFDGLPVHFADNPQDFADCVKTAIDEKPVEYNIDFEYYLPESRMEEYRQVVKTLIFLNEEEQHVQGNAPSETVS